MHYLELLTAFKEPISWGWFERFFAFQLLDRHALSSSFRRFCGFLSPGMAEGALCFLLATISCFSQVLRNLIPGDGKGYTVFLTGHSLGGALATLCAVDVRVRMRGAKVVMYNFGSPKVGSVFAVRLFHLVKGADSSLNYYRLKTETLYFSATS